MRRVKVCDALVVPSGTLPNASGPPVTLRSGVLGAARNSTAPASTDPFVFLALPKKSRPGASLKLGFALDGM